MLRHTLLSILAFGSAFAQAAPDFAAKADAYVQSWTQDHQFRGAVLVAKDGKVVFRKAYGNANDEWDIANTPDTKFRLGSITKQFTAVAILQLVDQGKLKLEDPVKAYYPDAPASWEKITIHHLLNHTSGIPSYTDQKDFATGQSRTARKPAEIIKLTQDMPLNFDPGTKYRYNNTGYILLGVILEKLTGMPYADYLRKHIFDPLGMQDTGYDSSAAVLKKRASGYAPNGQNTAFLDMSLPYAAGSLYSTVDDLVKWDEALYSEKLLKEETFAKMTTAGLSDYGYGLQMRTVDGRPAQAHGGGINGFNTYMIRLPGEHLMAVALANQNGQGPDAIAAALARIYLGADVPPRVRKKAIRLSAEQLDRYSGNYQLAPNFVMKVWREGERMMTQATGQSSIEIFASAEDRFFPAAVEAELVFERGSDGRVTGLTLHQNGRSMPAKRTSE